MIENVINGIISQVESIIELTAESAKELLDLNTNNLAQRDVRPLRVMTHRKSIRNRVFFASLIVIGVYRDGRTIKKCILDGQHRLMAIIEENSPEPVKLCLLEITADKDTIRQLYGFFDPGTSARKLPDLLKFKTAYHPELKEKWGPNRDLVSLAKSLQYASGHYFAPMNLNNSLPKGVKMTKDELMSDSLDVQRWWFALDQLSDFFYFLETLDNTKLVKRELGVIAWGAMVDSYDRLTDRARRETSDTFKNLKKFWKELAEHYDAVITGRPSTSSNLVQGVAKKRAYLKAQAINGKGDQTLPGHFMILYKACELAKQDIWSNRLGLSEAQLDRVDKSKIIADCFMNGRAMKPIHPSYSTNRYIDG